MDSAYTHRSFPERNQFQVYDVSHEFIGRQQLVLEEVDGVITQRLEVHRQPHVRRALVQHLTIMITNLL